jgi:nucleoid DNA-binding protein
MTKAEFIMRVAKKCKLSKAQTAKIIDATLEEVEGLLKKGDSISFTGFGTFSISKRKARRGRHPRTGNPMIIAAAKVPRFRAGKNLKAAVR